MKKTVLMSAAKKARIALAVMAVCGMSFVGARSVFAADPLPTTDLPVKIDANKNIICGDGAKVEKQTGPIPELTPDVENAIILGNNAEVGGKTSIAIGYKAKTGKSNRYLDCSGSVAIGCDAQALEEDTTAVGNRSRAHGSNSTVIGCDAQAFKYCSTAVGSLSLADGRYSTAIGYHAYAFGEDSIAIGLAVAREENSIAIGNFSNAIYKNSIAIGYNSFTDAENTVSVGGVLEQQVWDSVAGEMVTQKVDNRRRITYVADGINDHDAATVGQVITNIQKNGNTLEFYTGKGADGSGTKKWEFDLAAGGSTLTQEQFNTMLDANTKFTGLQTEVGNKANANGDNITTGAGSKWAENLGTGAIANGDKNLVNGETVYNKIGDTSQLENANLGNNLSDAVVKVNTKAEAAQTTANSALNKAKANENKIGDLTQLKTTEKGNLVGAVNDVYEKADKNAKDIASLGSRVDTLGGAVSKLDTKVNKVGAGAAALAALHPMDFDPDNKLTFAAGVGNYRGANAAAIGAFYRPNEQVMFSIAGNMGNGENMVNAGVSFALDRPSQTPTTKAALVKTVAAQNEQIAALNETVAEQNEKIARLEAMVDKLVAKQNA